MPGDGRREIQQSPVFTELVRLDFALQKSVPVRESLLKMRDDLDDLRSRLDVADEVAETLPHRAKYLRLNHHLARRVVDAYEEWLGDVERELDSEPPAGDYGLRGSRP